MPTAGPCDATARQAAQPPQERPRPFLGHIQMKLSHAAPSALALGLAAALLCLGGNEVQASMGFGSPLGLSQRDFRVFNNFSSPAANDNQTPHPSFPGHQGAVMAIWKGAVEWGSIAHGDGSGDPTQPIIGSGGANFDASFQGETTGPGNTNGNVHSAISGSFGGMLSFTETPAGDGWRVRYYDVWNWSDGPDVPVGNEYDLQGFACRAHGFALGLGSSSDQGATMFPTAATSSNSVGTNKRSISDSDIAALQSLYGVMSPTKPVITGLTIAGSQMKVHGQNFSAKGNVVWFTQAGSNASAALLKADPADSDGFCIEVTIPASAGPGDVLVRRPGSGLDNLSNAWPTDLADIQSCGVPVTYCTSMANSAGNGATVTSIGSPSLSTNQFTLAAVGLPPNTPGLFFYAPNQNNVPFGDGVLCVSGSIQRLSVQTADFVGAVIVPLDLTSPPFDGGPSAAVSCETMNFQYWYRDAGFGGAGFNTTDAIAVNFCD